MKKEKGGGFGVLTAALLKGKKLMVLVKTLKVLKPLFTFSTMIASMAVYAFTLGPWLAIGFVLMIFIHEMGHVIALRKKGIPASLPIFIPMLGAAIFAPKMYKRSDEAYVGFAGPLVGGAAAALLFASSFCLTHYHTEIVVLSYLATFVNLFNMVPVRPLDGGRVTQIVGDWFKYLGMAMMLVLVFWLRSPGLLLVGILILDEAPLTRPVKAAVSIVLEAVMIIMMCFGLGHQSLLSNIIDIVLATILNAYYLRSARRKRKFKNAGEDEDEQPVRDVPAMIRYRWLAYYILLVGALSLLMWFQVSYLPVIVGH